MSRLKEKYKTETVPYLLKEFQFQNVMQVPKLEKIIVNIGVGEAIQNARTLDAAMDDLMVITGQRSLIRRAKKSIAGFKLREGMIIGCMVTLRQQRMYEFYDRLVNVALPRVRDFRGVSPKGFDGRGNYSLGILEQIIFPEINYDKVDKMRGMGVTIVTTARNDEEGYSLLKHLGMPLKKK